MWLCGAFKTLICLFEQSNIDAMANGNRETCFKTVVIFAVYFNDANGTEITHFTIQGSDYGLRGCYKQGQRHVHSGVTVSIVKTVCLGRLLMLSSPYHVKPKVYFSFFCFFFAYASICVQCAWSKFHHYFKIKKLTKKRLCID